MNTIKITLTKDLKMIEIVPFADIHYGDKNCDVDLLKEKIKYVNENKHVYCVINGDIINNATKTSISDVYSDVKTPMQQLEEICKLFEPIKDKILAITLGNHEFRTWKYDGIDLTKLFALNLGIEDKYCKESALLFLRFGKQSSHLKNREVLYVIYMTHGSGGGRKEGAKAIRLADMATIVDADIYIHSHTHLPMVMKENFHRVVRTNSSVYTTTKMFINTSSMLNYGGYGEMAEFKPSAKDCPHIFLNGTTFEFTAKL